MHPCDPPSPLVFFANNCVSSFHAYSLANVFCEAPRAVVYPGKRPVYHNKSYIKV